MFRASDNMSSDSGNLFRDSQADVAMTGGDGEHRDMDVCNHDFLGR